MSRVLTHGCCHVMATGALCGAYALRDSELCYWHHKAREGRAERKKAIQNRKVKPSGIVLPLLEDANSVQMAIQMVAQAVADRRISRSEAGSLLYACQLAIMNLKGVTPPQKAVHYHMYQIPAAGDEYEDLTTPYEIPVEKDPPLEEEEDEDDDDVDDEDVDEEEVASAEKFVMENRARLKRLGVDISTG